MRRAITVTVDPLSSRLPTLQRLIAADVTPIRAKDWDDGAQWLATANRLSAPGGTIEEACDALRDRIHATVTDGPANV